MKGPLLFSLTLLTLSGCASIVTEDTKQVNVVTSTGESIEVSVDGSQHNVPGIVRFAKTGEDKVITTSADNCAKETVAEKKIETAFWGNILIGGLLGSTTDSTSDKMWTYDKEVTISCQ